MKNDKIKVALNPAIAKADATTASDHKRKADNKGDSEPMPTLDGSTAKTDAMTATDHKRSADAKGVKEGKEVEKDEDEDEVKKADTGFGHSDASDVGSESKDKDSKMSKDDKKRFDLKTEGVDIPMTKTGIISKLRSEFRAKHNKDMDAEQVSKLHTLDDEALRARYQQAMSKDESYREEDQPAVVDVVEPHSVDSKEKAEKIKAKADSKKASRKKDVKEAVEGIFSDETAELSEGFKAKAETLFEATVYDRVEKEVLELEEEAKAEMTRRIEGLQEGFETKTETFLTYVTEKWAENNKIALESGIKVEMAEEAVSDIVAVLEKHNITLTSEDASLLEQAVKDNEELEATANTKLQENAELRAVIAGYEQKEVLNKLSEGLVETDKDRLKDLSESISFENKEDYEGKLKIIRESTFVAGTKVSTISEEKDGSDIVELNDKVKNDFLTEDFMATLKRFDRK